MTNEARPDVHEEPKVAGDAGLETRVAVLDSGEEAVAALKKFANDAQLTTASLTAMGAFEKATVGWFDFEKKTYKKIEVGEQCEVLSAIGGKTAMGFQGTPARLFYDFCVDEHVPSDHLLKGVDRHLALDDLRQSLKPFYSQMGRPSVDPELMIHMLIVGYCMGIRSARRLCDEVHLNPPPEVNAWAARRFGRSSTAAAACRA
jgi:hypothetical protein